MKGMYQFAISATLALALAGCASTKTPPASIVSARSAYETASRDPAAGRNAQLELQQAQGALTNAEDQWHKRNKKEDVDAAAYVAERKAELAQETGRLREAEARLQNAGNMSTQALVGAQNRRIQQLQGQLDELKSGRTPRGGMVLTLGGDVLFDTGKAELKAGAADTIRQVASYLKGHPDTTAVVRGYTDDRGNADANLRLSQARADSVKASLLQEGVSVQQLQSFGLGESAPVASNSNNAGRQLNRRVEIALSGEGRNQTTGSLQ